MKGENQPFLKPLPSIQGSTSRLEFSCKNPGFESDFLNFLNFYKNRKISQNHEKRAPKFQDLLINPIMGRRAISGISRLEFSCKNPGFESDFLNFLNFYKNRKISQNHEKRAPKFQDLLINPIMGRRAISGSAILD